jgi:cation diffusion facilitator CzcD-associated flavoprotein CzcO
MTSDAETEVAIIGAGPYGLALSAYLREYRVEHRIFGIPMESWRTKMPNGMLLKSHGFASNLYDPHGAYTLKRFCLSNGLAYDDYAVPIPLQTFCDYGIAFQKMFVPDLEEKMVAALERTASGFLLRLETGEEVHARRVVCAIGIAHFPHVPAVFNGLSSEFVTHSSRHRHLDSFKGHDVTVVGAGASAIDIAWLLHCSGATVRVLTLRPYISFGKKLRIPRTRWDVIRAPMSGLGEGWRSRLCADAPLVFHRMPAWARLKVVQRHLGPAGGWFMRDQVESHVPFVMNVRLAAAATGNGRVRLRIRRPDRAEWELVTDHVIAATGYKVDLARLSFLGALKHEIHQVASAPVLTSRFESSVPGFYFIGVAAANSFGPLLRFAYGAQFAARRVSEHLARISLPKTTDGIAGSLRQYFGWRAYGGTGHS